MKEFANENRVNAVNFIELNILLSQTIDIIDPDGNTDTQKVETNLQEITKRLNELQPGTKPETQAAVKQYQDAVKEFIAEARNYIIINSSYGEAYTQLYVKYNRMISRANEVDMNDLDAVDSKKIIIEQHKGPAFIAGPFIVSKSILLYSFFKSFVIT